MHSTSETHTVKIVWGYWTYTPTADVDEGAQHTLGSCEVLPANVPRSMMRMRQYATTLVKCSREMREFLEAFLTAPTQQTAQAVSELWFVGDTYRWSPWVVPEKLATGEMVTSRWRWLVKNRGKVRNASELQAYYAVIYPEGLFG